LTKLSFAAQRGGVKWISSTHGAQYFHHTGFDVVDAMDQ
jgi:hypothetical protein